MSSRRQVVIVAVAACAAVAVAVAAFAQGVAPPPPVPVKVVPEGIDFTAEALKVLGSLATIIVSAIAVEIRGVVKDKAAQDSLISVLEHGSAFVVNKTAGALKNTPLTVHLASPMAADLVRYAKDLAPKAIDRLGIDDVQLAKMAIARLPNVNGSIDDKEIHDIAAKATGRAQAPPPDLAALAVELAPLIRDALAKQQGQAGQPQGSGAA